MRKAEDLVSPENVNAKAAKAEKPKLKKALLNLAKRLQADASSVIRSRKIEGVLDETHAKQLWTAAHDGSGVTMQEFATLENILNNYMFTKKARTYLDALVTKHESGTSMYKKIKKVLYDRSCLDLAEHLFKDKLIDLKDARLLWEDVQDGIGVTEVEKRTIKYIIDNYKLSDGAKKFLKDELAGRTPTPRAPPASASAAAGGSSAAPTAAAGGGGWHGSTGFGAPPPYQGGNVMSKRYQFDLNGKAFGLFVDGEHCYAGDETGFLVQLAVADGTVKQKYQLPAGVKCMVADGGFLFAGCNNGSLYDLTGGRPRMVAQLEDFSQVLWLDIHGGNMVAGDATGAVAMLNCDGETLWKKKSAGEEGWMVRVDASGVYHGHSKGVTKYTLEGEQTWHCDTEAVLFGCLEGDNVYASLVEPNCFDGEVAKRLSREGAKTGEVVCSLIWNNIDDLDLHVYAPSGAHLCYMNKRSRCGGELDVDMNNASTISTEPVENVFWAKAPLGTYRVAVISYNNRSGDAEVPFEVHINVRGEVQKFAGTFEGGQRIEKVVHTFTLTAKEEGAGAAGSAARLPQRGVVRINKETGELAKVYDAGSSVPSTVCAPNESRVFAAVPQGVLCLAGAKPGEGKEEGADIWKLGTGAGSAMSMQYHSGAGADSLFLVCGNKVVCADISPEGIAKAREGASLAGVQIARGALQETTAITSAADLEAACDSSEGIIVTCVKQGSKLRVRPKEGQAGIDASMNVQFPRDLRSDGASFKVDGLVAAGGFYRVQGEIRRM